MKYRAVELMLNWIIYLVYFGRNTYRHITYITKTSLIYQQTTYKQHIDYIPKKYIHAQHPIYIREAYRDTATYKLYQDVHIDITMFTEGT